MDGSSTPRFSNDRSTQWSKKFSGVVDVMKIPTDFARASQPGARLSRHISFSPALASSLRDLARAHDAPLLAVVVSAWAILLRRWCDHTSVAIGITASGTSEDGG